MPPAPHGTAVTLARMAAAKRRVEFVETRVQMRIAGLLRLVRTVPTLLAPPAKLEGGKRSVDQPLPTLRGLIIHQPVFSVTAAIVVGRRAVHPRRLVARRRLLGRAGVHLGRDGERSRGDDEGSDQGLGKHVSVLWVLGRLRSDTRPLAGGNIRQGAAIEREAGHSRISFSKNFFRTSRQRHDGRRLPDAGYDPSAGESGSTKAPDRDLHHTDLPPGLKWCLRK